MLIGQHLGLRRFGAACRTSELSLFLAVDDLNRPYAHELLTGGTNPNGRRLRLARIRHWRLPLLLVKARDRYRTLSYRHNSVHLFQGIIQSWPWFPKIPSGRPRAVSPLFLRTPDLQRSGNSLRGDFSHPSHVGLEPQKVGGDNVPRKKPRYVMLRGLRYQSGVRSESHNTASPIWKFFYGLDLA